MQLCESWTKIKQESGLSQADHPLLVGPLLIEIRASMFWIRDDQNSGYNLLQIADFNRILINNDTTKKEGGFPVGLCVMKCDVILVVVKVHFRKTSIRASAADSRNKSKQIWSAAAKQIFQHKELKKNKQTKTKKQSKTKNCSLAVLNRKWNDECSLELYFYH